MPNPASLVAADLIDAARDMHVSFGAQPHPPTVLLRALSRYQRRLIRKIQLRNRGVLVSTQETALPLADFTAGVTLPDFKYPSKVEVETTESGVTQRHEVELVSWQAANRYHRAAYIRDGVLYLTNEAGDWTGYTLLRFYYVAEVDALTALTGDTGTLVVPNAAEPCLVAYLAYFMAKRQIAVAGVEPPNARELREEWLAIEDEFLGEMAGHTQATTSVIREVF